MHKREGKIIVPEESEKRIESLDSLKTIFLENIDYLGERWASHLPLFLGSSEVARILWLNTVYQAAINVPGSVVEFGCQWGASLNIFNMLRLVYEPWNVSRKIIGFSLFEKGFKDVSEADGKLAKEGDYGVKNNWESILDKILSLNQYPSPTGKNHKIIEGDVSETFEKYLNENLELVISHAHFDLDIYLPTKNLLAKVAERMPKGAVIIFDEINHPGFPGETLALHEVFGLSNLNLRKSPFQPYSCYAIIQ
jgi:hypothetical protein